MRRIERALTFEEGIAILKKAEYGVLAFNGLDAYPHAVPMSFAYAEGDSEIGVEPKIYFHAAKVGYKTACIEASPACCFTVVGDTQVMPEAFSTRYESCIIYGELQAVEEAERGLAFRAILEKYSHDFITQGLEYAERSNGVTALYFIKINQMTVKGRK
jgi:hypothetical protein